MDHRDELRGRERLEARRREARDAPVELVPEVPQDHLGDHALVVRDEVLQEAGHQHGAQKGRTVEHQSRGVSQLDRLVDDPLLQLERRHAHAGREQDEPGQRELLSEAPPDDEAIEIALHRPPGGDAIGRGGCREPLPAHS
jgi:hypothetical protein